ncbi:MAG: putative peptidase [Pedosphaera sp.]|nr:putative peptidase [Pedosphaera sp.]
MCNCRKPSKAVAVSFLVWLIFGPAIFAQQFTPISIAVPGVSHGSVAWGDYDKDGDLDLLITGDTGAGLITRIYRNDGGTNFVDIQAALPGVSTGSAVWGDYNGDGYLDFALTGMSSTGRVTRIYRNNGAGTFVDINANLPGLEGAKVAWGDYDNDGDLDLFLTGYTGSTYVGRIYRNDGNDVFTDSGITTVAGGADGSAAWADFDNDGDLDLVFAGFTGTTGTGQSSRLYRNNGGTFTNITGISLTAMSACSLAWGDYDNDGSLDLLMAGSSISGVQSFPTLRLYRNNGLGTGFTSISTALPGAQNCSLAWGDFDNDGRLDVAIAGYNTSFVPFVRIYRNLGSGIFSDSGASIANVIDSSIAWGDFDNDGDLDLLVTGFDGTNNVTRLYRNDTAAANAPPSPPSGLNVNVAGKTATFSWNAGADANQSGGFSYNLRVGTAPGADNVMAGMADPVTGFRRVPLLGNTSERLSWTLKLPVGTYYWGAQTIDHAFAGSVFGAEQSFAVPAQAPDVVTLAATNINLNSSILPGTANPNGDGTVVYFEYGTSIAYGSTTAPQSLGSGITQLSFSANITNLLPAVTYQFRAVASNSFGVTYGANLSFITPLFSEVTTINLLGVGASSVAWGDYDNDGYLDLLIAGGTSSNAVTRIYRNLGGTNLVDIQAGLPGISGGQVMWGDFDNDGRLDVLVTGSGLTRIFHNDGGNTFTDINAGLNPGVSAVWTDFDNDGDLDLIITGSPTKTYRNDGGGKFTDVTNSLPSLYDSSIALADYDNDGDMDLLATGYNGGVSGVGELARLYRNDGRGNFTNSNTSLQSVSRGSVAWGDYDNDGDLDILLTGTVGSGLNRYSMIYSNNGAGGFVSKSLSFVAKSDQSSVAWGDYDNDGDLDFVESGMTSTGAVVRVYRNDGSTVFKDGGAVLPGLSGGSVAWGDFDNDGRLDLLITGYSGSNYMAKIYRNLNFATNTPPSAPPGLSAAITNDAVIFSWNPATDPNQPGGLSYNLRVGTTPGAGNIVDPMADSTTGFRRVPRLGNANFRKSWTITNLDVGTFYWSVQAIDNSFIGSSFASEQAVVMPARGPRAFTVSATNITPASATLTGKANPEGLSTAVYFEYGTTTNYGFRSATQNLGAGPGLLPVALPVGGLGIGSTNQFRLVASNSLGVAYGNNLTFVTLSQFTELPFVMPGLSANYTGQWGDYDKDGRLDVLYTGFDGSANLLRVIRCVSNTNFALVTNANLAQLYGATAWGDFDGDGDLDFAVCGMNAYNTQFNTLIYRNDGNGVFTEIGAGLAGVANGSINWVDYDKDGDLDLLVTGRDSGSAGYGPSSRLYRNDGNDIFTQVPISIPGVLNSAVAWGDYDNDGYPDVLVSGNGGSTNLTKLFHNNGGGSFTEVPISIPGVQNGAVTWGDYDNDNHLDILISGDTGSGYISKVYHNNGNGTFTEISTPLPGMTGSAAAWGDYDNDGLLDILIAGTTSAPGAGNHTFLFRNQGAGIFVDSGLTLPPIASGTVAWGDYDHDGNLDILLVGPGAGGGIHLLRNNQPIADVLPTAPGNLASSPSGSGATLSWAAATDANQSGGLTYNVRIGTAQGLGNIASPQADPTTGLRQLPQFGNAGQRLSYSPTNLPVGSYYWAVQAIDNAFAGSAFSSESNFTIPPRQPDAITLPATNVVYNAAVLRGLANPNGLATTAYFQYGTTTNYGSTTTPQASGNGTTVVLVSDSIAALTPGVTYSFRLVASNSLGVVYGTNQTFTAPQFTEVATGLPDVFYGAVAWGDFDNDGYLDFFMSSLYVSAVFHGSGTGNFTNVGAPFVYLPGGSVACADYDNDGDLDILMAGRDGGYLYNRQAKLYRNNANDTFTDLGLNITGVETASVAWADYDNDGALDFVVTGTDVQGAAQAHLYHNDGNDQFSDSGVVLVPVGNGSLVWGDYDNDGYQDLLLSGRMQGGGRVTIIYRNDGHGGFTDIHAGLPGLDGSSVAWGDYDLDGKLDLLLSGYTDNGPVTLIFHNDGGGVFHDIGAGLPASVIGTASWGDFDNDGYPDILLTAIPSDSAYVSKVFRNNGNGTFIGQSPSFAGVYGDHGTFADYDNDGDLDIMIAGGNTAQTKLLRNNVQTPNTPPNSPSGLVAIPHGNAATLTWSPASDPNQSGGLSYNLRIGRTPGTSDVLTPMANASTGFRRLPALGNVNEALSKTLTNLPVGAYYWSVQSIDNSFAGSTFAPESSFVVPVQAPAVISLGYSNLLADGVMLNARVNPNGAITFAYFDFGLTTNYGAHTASQNLGGGVGWSSTSATLTFLQHTSLYHYRLVASNSFGVCIGPDQTFSTPLFTLLNIGLVAAPGTFAAGDFNNDGKLDFAFTANISDYTRIYLGSADNTFTDSGVRLPGLNSGYAEWGDYDRDGRLDLLLSGYPLSACTVYRNTGANSLTNINAGLKAGSGTWADYDNDGKLDVLVAGNAAWQLYHNAGGGQFTSAFAWTGVEGNVAWGDFDNDGHLDFVISGVDTNSNPATRLYRNNGLGGFTLVNAGLTNLFGRAAWGDYDNDGNLDLLISGAITTYTYSPGVVKLYRNHGGGVFTEVPTTLPNVNANILWADYDNDGKLDIIMSGVLNWPALAAVFHNDDNGVFTDAHAGWTPVSGDNSLACGDFDNDGDLDFLVAGYTGTNYVACFYQNNCSRSNAPPGIPTGLSGTVTGSGGMLNWSPPAAAAPQNGGLSYNVRVGTAPGKDDVMSAMASPNTGWRKVPKLGNVQQNLNWGLTNLPPGTYYWSVQSINQSFIGSAFAPEMTFVRSVQPVAKPQVVVLAEDTTCAVTLTGSDPDGNALTFAVLSQPNHGNLSGVPPNLVYQPFTNFFGADGFTFGVGNAVTNSTPAQIALVVTQVPDVNGASLSISRTNNQFTLSLVGEPYDQYRIEASQDLIHWLPVTNLLATNGVLPFIDPDAGLYPYRFYRSVLQLTPSLISSPNLLSNGSFQFTFTADVGRYYQLLASTNLQDWMVLTNLAATTSNVLFLDLAASNYPYRFYKTLPSP